MTFVDIAYLANLGCRYALAVKISAALRMMLNMIQLIDLMTIVSIKPLFLAPLQSLEEG
jgi:pentose-5-phosphate-3-epimerase